MAINSQAEEFVRTYNDLDRHLRKKYGLDDYKNYSDVINLASQKDKYVNKYKEHLKTFGNLRNAIVHHLSSEYCETIAEPHPRVNILFDKMKNDIMDPPKALHTLAIPIDKVYKTHLDENVLEVMRHMNKNAYTHVPVMKDDIVIGVFSENTLFSYIVKNEVAIIESTTTIAEFGEFLPLNQHESECFEFVNKNASVIDIEELFSKNLVNGKRLSVIFITHSGRPIEKILGIITAWDVAGYKESN
nr:CBS domain-containing protein [uncultured Niameybacter sp.]